MWWMWLGLIPVLFLTGCAPEMKMSLSEGISPTVINSSQKKGREINLILEPHETLGIEITDSIRQGNISVYRGVFPEVLLGEYSPGRIRWNGVVRQESDGKEFFAQFLFSPPDVNRNIIWTIVIDGRPDETAKITQLSTAINFGYSAFGEEFVIEEQQKFLDDENGYRANFISEKGTPLSELRKIKAGVFYRDILSRWNPWMTYSGKDIWSPLGEKEMEKISAINPQYSYSQKLIAKGHFMLCADPIAITASAGIDFIAASESSSNGWDYTSEFSNRRNMGIMIVWINQLKDRNFRNADELNALFIQQGGTP